MESKKILWTKRQSNPGMKGTLACKLHLYLKFHNHVIVFVSLETLGTFIEYISWFQTRSVQIFNLFTEGILLFIIIEDIYKLFVHCLITYDPL